MDPDLNLEMGIRSREDPAESRWQFGALHGPCTRRLISNYNSCCVYGFYNLFVRSGLRGVCPKL